MKILLVDDTKSVHAYIKAVLPMSDFSFHDVYNGREAVDLLASGAEFDLILLDWEMPEMDGPTTLKALRGRGVTTPIIMVTTKNDVENITEALSHGANEYVLKPFTGEILAEKIAYVTGREAV